MTAGAVSGICPAVSADGWYCTLPCAHTDYHVAEGVAGEVCSAWPVD